MTVIAFDVNETLLDLRVLDPLLGDTQTRFRWFSTMLQVAFVGGLTGNYVDFPTAQRAALKMLGLQGEREIGEQMRRLPPHPDVAVALERLHGFTVVALTNSPIEVAEAQLENAGIRDYFDAVFSGDQVRALKPRPEPYRFVADSLGVGIGDVWLVAAHGWDIAGALAVGCRAAFVKRPGQGVIPIGIQPEVIGEDLVDAVERIRSLS